MAMFCDSCDNMFKEGKKCPKCGSTEVLEVEK